MRRFRIRRALSVLKSSEYRNEDSLYLARCCVLAALSDGASVSFDPAAWANILTRRFVADPNVTHEWINAAVDEFNRPYDRQVLPWMQQAAFDRGTFATLLGVQFKEETDEVVIFGIGDTIAVLCDDDRILVTWPYERAEQFDTRPDLLSTNRAENVYLHDRNLKDDLTVRFKLSKYETPRLFLVTDALGLWLLEGEAAEASPISVLLKIRNKREFACFVENERAAGRLRRDDTSLVGLW